MRLKQILNNKKSISILIFILVLIEVSNLFLMGKSLLNKNNVLEEVKLKNNDTEMFAILLEQDNGEYVESNASTWPDSDEYIYNKEKSGCMNSDGVKMDGALKFYRGTNKAKITVQEVAYCYLYFDKIEELVGEAYALYTESNSTLTFVRSETPIKVGDTYNNQTITAVYTGFEEESYAANSIPWYDYDEFVIVADNIVFSDEIRPISTAWWFYEAVNIDKFDIAKLNTSLVSDMSSMFHSAEHSNIIGLENLDVSNVQDMKGMFEYSNVEVDLSNWDVSNVTNMSNMLGSSYGNVTGIENWDVSNVINMEGMFSDFDSKSDVDLSNWDVSNVTDMSGMFSSLYANVIGLEHWDVSNVTDMSYMFYEATTSSDLTSDLSRWDTSNVTDMSFAFVGVTFNKENQLSGWDTSNVTNMLRTFEGATFNTNIGLSNWDVSNVTDMSYMFSYATVNINLNLVGWDVSNVATYQGFNSNVSGTGTLTPPIWPVYKTDTEKLIERETIGTDLWVSTLKDDGYRFVGTNPPNYICFGTTDKTTCTSNPDLYMYRIIGSFADSEGKQHLKLIKKEALNTSYAWDINYEDIPWGSSSLYNGLNGNYFLNNPTYSYMQNDTWFSKIETWDYMAANNKFENTSRSYGSDRADSIYMHEMLRDSRYMEEELGSWATVPSKIGVIYTSDYMLSLGSGSLDLYADNDSATLKTGWMHLSNNDSGAPSQDEWSMAREGYLDGENYVYSINRDGSLGATSAIVLYSVRPVFYLKSDVEISGSGDASDPYRLS